ncbi:serine--tRNA ligase, chloroplastic/mitochondrial [Tetranychus urticae]|uniref:serine--tRNA ligase n=1 Tax=Tetranychus urticae TaxID=32264 RepID=T1JPM1_TETUR|nr:serine--tRNA ligase, chloroplastic/mitochondrial [Tetranychus urticae]
MLHSIRVGLQLKKLAHCLFTPAIRCNATFDGWRDWKRFDPEGSSITSFDYIERDYYLSPEKREEVVDNIRKRRLKNLVQGLEKCSNDEEIVKLLEANVNHLPNKLDERWIDYKAGSNIEDFIVEEFGLALMVEEDKIKKALNIANKLGIIQTSKFDSVGVVTSTRSYALLAELAQLHQALIDWTMDELISRFDFTPVIVPNIVYEDAIIGCGYQPRGRATQVYKLLGPSQDKPWTRDQQDTFDGDVCLAGTSEIPLTGLHVGATFNEDELPKKYCTVSRCYRAEISKVKTETGIYRVPYFSKVEMYSLTREEDSSEMLFEFMQIQKHLMSLLNFKCRVIDMPPEELGLSATRKFDIQVYLPGSKMWGEVSSASNCTDYQSRRFNIKYKVLQPDYETNEPFVNKFAHTINATACALPRILLAIIEYGQNQDGAIIIPPVLRNYMNGKELIDTNRHLFTR